MIEKDEDNLYKYDREIEIERPSSISMILLILFVISYLVGAIWLFIEGWLNQFMALNRVWGYPGDKPFPEMLQSALFSLVGAIMGCGVLGITSFYRYVCIEDNFKRSHVWGYYLAPILAGIVGLMTFALLQSGLLIFSGGVQNATPVSHLGYLALGFLSGFSWYRFTSKADEIASNLFVIKKDKRVDRADDLPKNGLTQMLIDTRDKKNEPKP